VWDTITLDGRPFAVERCPEGADARPDVGEKPYFRTGQERNLRTARGSLPLPILQAASEP
jgi:hypothetical protein